MTIKQKIELYGFKGMLRRKAIDLLLRAISAGMSVDEVQFVVTKLGTDLEIIGQKKNG